MKKYDQFHKLNILTAYWSKKWDTNMKRVQNRRGQNMPNWTFHSKLNAFKEKNYFIFQRNVIRETKIIYNSRNPNHIWGKLFKTGPSKICGRQVLKNLKGYGMLETDYTSSNVLKAVLHKFYLVHSWILCPIYTQQIILPSVQLKTHQMTVIHCHPCRTP